MRCKNKAKTIIGTEYNDAAQTFRILSLLCICTNDERGKTLSIDNGTIQFSIPMEQILPYFEGDYKK